MPAPFAWPDAVFPPQIQQIEDFRRISASRFLRLIKEKCYRNMYCPEEARTISVCPTGSSHSIVKKRSCIWYLRQVSLSSLFLLFFVLGFNGFLKLSAQVVLKYLLVQSTLVSTRLKGPEKNRVLTRVAYYRELS